MAFSHRLRVRYHECDMQRIVFNANYVAYLDIALTELYREGFGSYDAVIDEHGVDLVVAEVTQRFRASATYDEELDVELTVGSIGTTSILTEARIVRGDDLITEGSIRHVCVDATTFVKTPVPEPVRDRLLAVAG